MVMHILGVFVVIIQYGVVYDAYVAIGDHIPFLANIR